MTPGSRPPGDRSHLERLLDSWARSDPGTPVQRLRRLVAFTVIAAMLDGLPGPDGQARLVIKGGAGLQLRLGTRARASSDLDTAFRGNLDEGRRLVGEALQAGWHGFAGRLGDEEEITRPGIVPAPRRSQVKLFYRRKPFATVAFEMSSAEGRSLDSPEYEAPAVSLEPVQIPDPETVALLPVRYQIAQKLHACSEPPSAETPNERAWDLYDILLLADLVDDAEYPALREACIEVFGLRAKQPWPPAIVVQPSWPATWRRLAQGEGSSLSLDEAFEGVTRLTARIVEA